MAQDANVCVALVRQIRGEFQNVSFMAQCIEDAALKTFLIAKTGTPDPSYKQGCEGTLFNELSSPSSVVHFLEL